MEVNNIQLNIHSHYSLLSGVSKIPDICKYAAEQQCKSAAITDTNNLYGAIHFYKAAREKDIKPIIGVSLLLPPAPEMHQRITLLAKNFTGYQNIIKLVTILQKKTQDLSTPYIKLEEMKGLTNDVIAIIPFINSEFTNTLLQNDTVNLDKLLEKYNGLFNNNLFFGVAMLEGVTNADVLKNQIKKVSAQKSIPMIASQPIYYLAPEDKKLREVLLKIKGSRINEWEEEMFEGAKMHFPTLNEMNEWFSDNKEAMDNLEKVDKSIDLQIELACDTKKWIFPKIDIGEVPAEELIRKYTYEGVEKHGLKETKELKDRVEYELKIILDKNYATYFLLYYDILDYCIKNQVTTCTRGSVAGSMVAYLLFITTVDPIKHAIPFERFLNPYRPSAPDIDLDLADDRREEVIKYIINKYGEDQVGQLGTFGTMLAKASLRDVARALGYSYTTGDRLAKLIPLPKQGFTSSIDDALAEEEELSNLYKQNKTAKEIINTAKRIEGNARHISIHASGVMVAPTALINYTPLQPNPNEANRTITQYDMYSIGEDGLGLTKLDILGIGFLSIIANALVIIKKERGEDIDLFKFTYDDKKTYEMISNGLTVGVFQLGSRGLRKMLRRLKPLTLYEVAAIIALFRPGPILVMGEYIKRKKGLKPAVFFHEKMRKYLDKSFGMLVFQDDLLYTAIEIAGYNWDEVDVFRKAMGKKIPELMRAQKEIFLERCGKHSGVARKDGEKIWELFQPFARYGYNKAHAFSYAQVSYQTAYLKRHYTKEYFTALLTSANKKIDMITIFARDCKRFDVKLLQPSINKSVVDFSIEEEGIRFGFSVIKSLGSEVASQIVKERDESGKFSSLTNMIERITKRCPLHKRDLMSLIQGGALDEFASRSDLLHNLSKILLYAKEIGAIDTNASTLFDLSTIKDIELEKGSEITREQELFWEKELLGTYLTGHPLERYKKVGYSIETIKEQIQVEEEVEITALISNLKFVRTKKKQARIAFLTLDDEFEAIEAVCFTEPLIKYEELIAVNRVVNINGKVTIKGDEAKSIVIDSITEPIKK